MLPFHPHGSPMPTEEYSCIFIVFLFYIPNHFNLNISLLFSFYFSSIKQSLFLFISYIFLFFLFLKYLLSLYFFSPYQTKPYKRWYISDLRDTNPINCIYTYTIFNKKKNPHFNNFRETKTYFILKILQISNFLKKNRISQAVLLTCHH